MLHHWLFICTKTKDLNPKRLSLGLWSKSISLIFNHLNKVSIYLYMLESKAFCPNCLKLTTIIDTYPNFAKLNCRQHVHEEIVCKVVGRNFFFLFLAEWKFSLIRNKGYISESNLPNERGRRNYYNIKTNYLWVQIFLLLKDHWI